MVVVLAGTTHAMAAGHGGDAVGRPSPQAALETLLQSSAGRAADSAPTSASVGLPVQASGRQAVAVERGQSLDALLRKHLAASPLKVEVLRDLVRQLNPQAFAPGGGHRLLAGARLQLPTAEDQMRHAFGKSGAAMALAREEAVESAAGPWGNGAAAAARRGWVRYP
jgi:Tfp pilus assembly protein FimV